MSQNEPWYLGERAEMLATVALTRNPGVSVQKAPPHSGIDLLASIDGERGGRVFGVEVKGTLRIKNMIGDNSVVIAPITNQLARLAGDSPYPVGLFIFDVSDDTGYFGWFLEPALSPDGSPTVRRKDPLSVIESNQSVIERVIEDVNRWYLARLIPQR